MVFDYIKNFNKLDVEICEVYSRQSFEVKFSNRVTADLKNLEMSGNLKETSKSQEICPKIQGICDRITKVREFLSEIHFQPS